MRKRIALVAAVALTILGLVGGTVAYATMNKTVALSVDGKVTEVKTFGGTVEEVLEGEDIEIGKHDAVAPSLDSAVEDGSRIAVRYGRELTLTVDGEQETHWVTAANVDAALSQIGRRFSGADLSTSRGAAIGREGLDLTVKTEKQITLVNAGKKSKETTTALNVREALSDLGVKRDKDDEVKPGLESEIDDGSRIRVVQIEKKTRTVEESIPNRTVVRENADMYEDQEKVNREGRDGVRAVTYRVVLANGEQRSRKKVKSVVKTKPVNRVEVHGTKERPEPEPSPDFSGGGTVWDRLADCESGDWDRHGAPVPGTARWDLRPGEHIFEGGLQFHPDTWDAFAPGVLDAAPAAAYEASRTEQIAVAEAVLDAQGWGAWPVCSRKLGLRA